ncbi:EAL and HDOD domain-containing protein [Legionella sp. CNM-4043-24]|uniref:EAL and HDOD domain-containing protein n=1 Tax=Legionella sp. CNM-4043-24 TaxID=3421646 RepID=UPI00403AAE5B
MKQAQTLLARQGIYDKRGAVYAYELLYRGRDERHSHVDNRDEQAGIRATSSVIIQLFANFDIDAIIGKKTAFINFTYSDIVRKTPALLPKDRIVIEVLETTRVDRDVICALQDLHQEGYKIALDDFVWREEWLPLLEIADFIKIDVLGLNQGEMSRRFAQVKAFKGKLLAEKIDNKEQFKQCIALGFDYFQGFFLNKPDIFSGQPLTENRAQILHLLTELNKEDISIASLEHSILEIPKLSYRILRISNSVYYYSGKKNRSLTDAIFRLGLTNVRNWTNMLLLASSSDASPDLLERTLIRAKMCELLARTINYQNPQQAFTVGIFSTLDGMLNESLDVLLAKIQLEENINEALLYRTGQLGYFLRHAIDYEEARFHNLRQSPFEREDLISCYFAGIQYADSIIKSLR